MPFARLPGFNIPDVVAFGLGLLAVLIEPENVLLAPQIIAGLGEWLFSGRTVINRND